MWDRTQMVLRAAVTGVTVALAIGCEKRVPEQGPSTPKPETFNAATVETTSVDIIAAFVHRKLGFDSELGADSGLVDFPQGLIGRSAGFSRIEPETASYRLSAQDAAEGRIIARIRSHDPIPSLGLGPSWWTWWWVDSIGTGHWRSIFIPENGKPPYPAPRRPLEVERHGYKYKQALARFRVDTIVTRHGDPFVIASWSNACGGCCKQRLPVLQ